MTPARGGADNPHLPQQARIDAYGKGGFRFAGMSHRGSLLCLPSGIWAWPVTEASQIDETSLARVFAETEAISLFLLGTGDFAWDMPVDLRWRFRDAAINAETMRTAHAANTYNILIEEGRRVAAALIAVA
jgi:uncharacterized protein